MDRPYADVGEPGQITIRAENIGYGPARQLCLDLGGSLVRPVVVDCRVLTPLAAESYFDITLQIVSSKADNTLRVQAEYVGRTPTAVQRRL